MTCDTELIYLVKDDNGSQVECIITRDNNNQPVDLTGATARLKFRKKKTTTILFTLTNIVDDQVDLEAGQAVFVFSAANLDLPAGLYEGEVEVTFPNLNVETIYEIIQFQVRDDF
ncbi:MAG TPA: BppU family phage baseplate upper protein [Rheinheimera sp.]|nr:BppU family phage baseplate upper protein [Rheinheimera sp.]